MLKYLRAIAIWLVPPFAVVALPTDAPGLTCLATIYVYLAGPCLAIIFFVIFFLTFSKPHPASALVLVVLVWLLVWQHGFTQGARIHLFVNEGRYQQKLSELSRATSAEERERICGDTCMPHSDGVVVFHYCHCFLSWPDLVYDPRDALNTPNDELQKISIYLHGTKRLSKFRYIGYFGD